MTPALLAVLLAVTLPSLAAADPAEREVLLATTTSVQDSGLLDALLPEFTKQSGVRVRVIAVGTGAALRMGAEGNADLLLTHAPESERELLSSGAVVSRKPFLENYFVIAGPTEDPAGVRAAASAPEALRRIRAAGAPYVSRGDDSGTHKREVALLEAAGVAPGWPGFASTGAGMGLTLLVAGERRAYTLSDVGTFLAFRERSGLVVLSKREDALRNEYSLLRVNPARFPERLHADAARALEHWLLRQETLERIAGFGRDRFGEALFQPLDARATPQAP